MILCDPRRGRLQCEPGAGSAMGMIGLITALVEGDHQGVPDNPVDVAPVLSHHGRHGDREVLVEHPCHLAGLVALGEGGEALEVGEQDADIPCPGTGLWQVQLSKTLLVPGDTRTDRDQSEGCQHQHVPLPPGQVPIARESHRHHRFSEQDEGRCHGEQHHGVVATPEVEIAHGARPVQQHRRHGKPEGKALHQLRRPIEWRQRRDRPGCPQQHHADEGKPNEPSDADVPNGALTGEIRSRPGGEGGAKGDTHGCGDGESGVGFPQYDPRRGQRVQGEEACRGQERERNVEQPCITPTRGRLTGGVSQDGRDNGRAEHEPEVCRMVLPQQIEIGPHKHQSKPEKGNREHCGTENETPGGRGGGGHVSNRSPQFGAVARYWWISDTTTDPSPTAEATLFTDPPLTSPTANNPGTVVSWGWGRRSRVQRELAAASVPVTRKSWESRSTSGGSQSVRGWAPIITNKLSSERSCSPPVTRSRIRTCSNRPLPCPPATSVFRWT